MAKICIKVGGNDRAWADEKRKERGSEKRFFGGNALELKPQNFFILFALIFEIIHKTMSVTIPFICNNYNAHLFTIQKLNICGIQILRQNAISVALPGLSAPNTNPCNKNTLVTCITARGDKEQKI